MEQSKESSEKKLSSSGQHSRFRKGLKDYGDAGSLTHYLGNDEYPDGNREPSATDEGALSGYEASGNDLTEEDIEAQKQEDLDERFSLRQDE